MNEFYQDNCLRVLKLFLRDNIYNVMAKVKVVEFFHNIEYMQRRIRDQLVKKDAKTEILMNYWDKMFGSIQVRATALGDKQGNALAGRLVRVPRDVRWAVLREYVDRCQELHAIAFL